MKQMLELKSHWTIDGWHTPEVRSRDFLETFHRTTVSNSQGFHRCDEGVIDNFDNI